MGNKRLKKRLEALEKELFGSRYDHGGQDSDSHSRSRSPRRSRNRSPRRSRRCFPSRIQRNSSRSYSRSRSPRHSRIRSPGRNRRNRTRSQSISQRRRRQFIRGRSDSRREYNNDGRSCDSSIRGYGWPRCSEERSLSREESVFDLNDAVKLDNSTAQVCSGVPGDEKPSASGRESQVRPPNVAQEYLQIFGERLVSDRVFAPAIPVRLAEIWSDVIIKGLPLEEKKKLLKHFPPPANVLMMDPPKLNLEVKADVDSSLQKRDERIIENQEKISASLAGISKTIELVLKSIPPEKKHFLEFLNGVMKILADLQHDETFIRRSSILKNIAAPVRDMLKDPPVDSWLFGKDLSEQLKAARAVQQSSKDLKPAVKNVQGKKEGPKNFKGPTSRNQFKENSPVRVPEDSFSRQVVESEIKTSNCKEKQLEVSALADRSALFAKTWTKFKSDVTILSWVSGYMIPFSDKVVQQFPPTEPSWFALERLKIRGLINTPLDKGAIEKCDPHPQQFLSRIFVVFKSDGSNRLILNLRSLNSFIQTEHFELEDGRTVRHLLNRGSFLASIDLQDAYHLLPVSYSYRKFLRFRFEGMLYQYTCLPFELCTAPYLFTKLMKPVITSLRVRGYVSVIYLDDILLFGDSVLECETNVQVTCQLLESWFSY